MKTAISIPESLFKKAEKVAKTNGISRSRLFTLAIESYLTHQNPERVTDALNRVYSESQAELDEGISLMQTDSLTREVW